MDKTGIILILCIFSLKIKNFMKNILVTFEVDSRNLGYTTELVNQFSSTVKEQHPGMTIFKSMTSAVKPNKFFLFLSFASDEDYDIYKKHDKTKKFTVKLHALSKELPVFTELNEVE